MQRRFVDTLVPIADAMVRRWGQTSMILTIANESDTGTDRVAVHDDLPLYHVIVRGNRRQKTFLNDRDYQANSTGWGNTGENITTPCTLTVDAQPRPFVG